MAVARHAATMSHAVRSKVGACLVTKNGVMVYGYNGTLAGKDNCCEIEVDGQLVTHDGVVHAERNALAKAGREGLSTQDSWVFLTLSPCEICATLLASFGVKGVIFEEMYRKHDGVVALLDAGLEVYEHRAERPHNNLRTFRYRATELGGIGGLAISSCSSAIANRQGGGVLKVPAMSCSC